jgi:hypothetical protein
MTGRARIPPHRESKSSIRNESPRPNRGFFCVLAVAAASCPGRESQQAGTALRSAARTAALVAGLLVIFPSSHFFLDAGMFNELSEPLDGIRDRFMFSQAQFDHKVLPSRE